MKTFTQKVITSEAEADRVVRNFEADGCTATKEEQADGTWTVVAECPDS